MAQTMEIMNINPDCAAAMLQSNERNRRISRSVVQVLAQQMSAGEWQLTGDAIRFDADGRLLDGQHRLTAIIAADVAIETVVIRGIDPAAQNVMDTGKNRRVAEQLSMDGMASASSLAATARNSLALRLGIRHMFNRYVTRTKLMEFVIANEEDLRDASHLAESVAKRFVGTGRSRFAGMAYDVSRIHGGDAAVEFFASIRDGLNLDDGDPVLALRNWLMTAGSRDKRRTEHEVGHALTRTWEARYAGEQLKLIRVPPASEQRYIAEDLDDMP